MSYQQKVQKRCAFLIFHQMAKAHPDYLNYFPMPKESISAQTLNIN
jgi:hypothetical protein